MQNSKYNRPGPLSPTGVSMPNNVGSNYQKNKSFLTSTVDPMKVPSVSTALHPSGFLHGHEQLQGLARGADSHL